MELVVLAPILLLTLLQRGSVGNPEAWILGTCILALAVFGGGVDMLHILVPTSLVGIVEDGGEMLSMAAACCSAVLFFREAQRAGTGAAPRA